MLEGWGWGREGGRGEEDLDASVSLMRKLKSEGMGVAQLHPAPSCPVGTGLPSFKSIVLHAAKQSALYDVLKSS